MRSWGRVHDGGHSPTSTRARQRAALILAVPGAICAGIPFLAGSLVSHGVNMTLEHLASAKYLTSGTMRTMSNAVGGLAHQVSSLAQYMHQRTTLNQRMEAGAAAAARISSSNPTTPLGRHHHQAADGTAGQQDRRLRSHQAARTTPVPEANRRDWRTTPAGPAPRRGLKPWTSRNFKRSDERPPLLQAHWL